MPYITVDPYYKVPEFKRMLQALKNNGVEYSLWIDVRPPHEWYIKVTDDNMPKFVDFDVKPRTEERYLVSVIVPQRSHDEYLLLRRETDTPTDYDRFVLNDYWTEALKSDYFIIFRHRSPEDVRKMTQDLGIKVFDLGKHRWRLFMGFSKYIKGYITQDQVLYEKTKKELKEFSQTGELEADFNYRALRTVQVENKTLETTYWKNGQKYPATKVAGV